MAIHYSYCGSQQLERVDESFDDLLAHSAGIPSASFNHIIFEKVFWNVLNPKFVQNPLPAPSTMNTQAWQGNEHLSTSYLQGSERGQPPELECLTSTTPVFWVYPAQLVTWTLEKQPAKENWICRWMICVHRPAPWDHGKGFPVTSNAAATTSTACPCQVATHDDDTTWR